MLRALELQSILDCADMAAAASLCRTESRWGLYHFRVDHPEPDNADWFCHAMLYKDADGHMAHRKREVDPYMVPIDDTEKDAYPLGLLMGRFLVLKEIVFPVTEVARPIPVIAWVPMSIMLWPNNEESIVFITF